MSLSVKHSKVPVHLSILTYAPIDVAKDNDASLSSRATAAKDAVVDKKDESSHNVSHCIPNLPILYISLICHDSRPRPMFTRRLLSTKCAQL